MYMNKEMIIYIINLKHDRFHRSCLDQYRLHYFRSIQVNNRLSRDKDFH